MAASIRACVCSFAFASSLRCQGYSVIVKRWYAKSIRRRPLASISPKEDATRMEAMGISVRDPRKNPYIPFIPGDPTQAQIIKPNTTKTKSERGRSAEQLPDKIQRQQRLPTAQAARLKPPTKGDNTELQYEKLEEGDTRFGRVFLDAKSGKEREKKGIILLEGRRLILDSLQAGAKLKYLYFSDISLVRGIPMENLKETKLYKVQRHHLKLWADTVTPAGIVGIFVKPAAGEVLLPQPDTLPMTLICDNVRDPGNMGTLIRTAAAAGCQNILATKGCVDIWDPKVLRSAVGSHFYIRILSNLTWENIGNYISSSTAICIADARKESYVRKQFKTNAPGVHSLLASAPGVEGDYENSDSDSEDSSSEQCQSESEEIVDEAATESKWTKGKENVYKQVPMHVTEYSRLDCSYKDGVALIVGGETEGVSAQARKFAFDRFGQYVTVPMVQAANSLNTAIAAAVILYEIRGKLVSSSQAEK